MPDQNDGHDLAIAVAGSSYLLCGLDDPQYEILRETLSDSLLGDDRLERAFVRLTVLKCRPGTLSDTKTIQPGEFEKFSYGTRAGFYSRGVYAEVTSGDKIGAQLYLDPGLQPLSVWAIENLLRVLLAYKVFADGGFLVHSAAIALDGRGYLFHGVSGSGKSTLSKQIIAEGGSVLSDDLNLVLPSRNGWMLRRIPFTGELTHDQCYLGDVPLSAVFSLRKGEQNEIRATTLANTAAALMVCVPYLNQDPRHTVALLDLIVTMLSSIQYGAVEIQKGPVLAWLKNKLGIIDDHD